MESTRAEFVLVSGVLDLEGSTRIEHVAPVEQPRRWPVGEGRGTHTPLMAEMQSKDATVILRHFIEVQPLCMHPAAIPAPPVDSPLVFGGVVPLPADAELLRVVGGATGIAERRIPSVGPIVRLTWDPAAEKPSGVQTIHWTADHPENAPMTHTVCVIREDGVWQPLTLPWVKPEGEVDFDQLPGGKIAVGVISTDGFNSTRAQSPPFERPPTACVAVIVSPADGEQLPAEQDIVLSGYGRYRENGATETRWLFWSDDQQGELGACKSMGLRLTPGAHVISLRAGSPGREGKAQVRVVVGAAK